MILTKQFDSATKPARGSAHRQILRAGTEGVQLMAKGFIEAHIARGNRNTFLIGLVLTVVGVALSLFLNRWPPAIIAVPGVIILGVWLLHVVNPRAHPVYKQLARYGDPQQLGAQINQEFAGLKADDKTQFGARWLAQGHTYGVALVPWSDIAWLHI